MTSYISNSVFVQGLRAGAPFTLVIVPFSVLFGVLATEAGLSVLEALLFSVAVIAGAAQFTALQLMAEDTATIVVLASALAVNLRMAMYSASLTPYLGAAPLWQRAFAAYLLVDQSYACAIARFEEQPQMRVSERMAFFFGCVTPVAPLWYLGTFAGALIGARVPDAWALDFALPITFLALLVPMLRSAAHLLAAAVAIAAALSFAFLPYNLGLIVGGLSGMIAGARAELWLRARGNPG